MATSWECSSWVRGSLVNKSSSILKILVFSCCHDHRLLIGYSRFLIVWLVLMDVISSDKHDFVISLHVMTPFKGTCFDCIQFGRHNLLLWQVFWDCCYVGPAWPITSLHTTTFLKNWVFASQFCIQFARVIASLGSLCPDSSVYEMQSFHELAYFFLEHQLCVQFVKLDTLLVVDFWGLDYLKDNLLIVLKHDSSMFQKTLPSWGSHFWKWSNFGGALSIIGWYYST